MCGIIGLRCKDTDIAEFIVHELLKASQIRGKHATGIAYYVGKKILKIEQPIPAKQFVDNLVFPNTSEYVIAHTRYSTSNLNYNQPLIGNLIGLVHNGIMTQEEPEKWKEHFAIPVYEDFKTKNDTELLLKCLEAKRQPFIDFPHCSIAAGILEKNEMWCFRGMTRPLWIFRSVLEFDGIPVFNGFASTKGVIERAFKELDGMFEVEITETKPFTKYVFLPNGTIQEIPMKSKPTLFNGDQQISTKIERKYV